MEKRNRVRIFSYIKNINKLKPIIVMKLVNVSLNVVFGSLSIMCLRGIAYAVGVVIINIV